MARNSKGQFIKTQLSINDLKDWLKDRVTVDSHNCWNWNSSIHRDGYGKINKHGFWQAHRLSFYCFNSSTYNKNLLVLHLCNNRKCINPKHLYQGNHRDNALDMIKANTSTTLFKPGQEHKNSKLTENTAIAILKLFHKRNWTVLAIAKWFNIPRTTVSSICHNHTWRHLNEHYNR